MAKHWTTGILCLAMALCGCGVTDRTLTGDPGGDPGGGGQPDLVVAAGQPDLYIPSGVLNRDLASGTMNGCQGELQNCYTVYAHSDSVLYQLDLTNKALLVIGNFNAPMVNDPSTGKPVQDVIQDLGVTTDGTIYVVSKTTLYVASAATGQVTVKGALTACGADVVALTLTPDNKMYAADFKGAFCRIDNYTTPTPTVVQVGMLGGGLAISGDIVSVADGTMFGTAYLVADGNTKGTGLNNLLVTINPATGQVVKMIGATGFPKLFGIAFQNGVVFGFTHDTTGRVITINPNTGVGTLYNTFTDSTTKMPISFAGAGVNANVPPPPVM